MKWCEVSIQTTHEAVELIAEISACQWGAGGQAADLPAGAEGPGGQGREYCPGNY